MHLNLEFDAVLMLTWSDWDTEPRSNRYHYASRFAKELPTFFFQHKYLYRDGIKIRPSELDNLEIVEISVEISQSDIQEIKKLLRNRGFRKPLIWIYDSIHYNKLINAFPNSYKIYHATEDYFTKTKGWSQSVNTVAIPTLNVLKKVDLLICVTERLEKVYKDLGKYSGQSYVIKNGCDSEFFTEKKEDISYSKNFISTVIFQGGINNRIDYELLFELITLMPDWQFKFCGKAIPNEIWTKILTLNNVRYMGELSPEEFRREMFASTVGIIPYIQDDWIRNSLPLKAYEYVACGLPVVTVPIHELELYPEIFSFAKTASDFKKQILHLKSTRYDEKKLAIRLQSAQNNSYNQRFEFFKDRLIFEIKKRKNDIGQKKMRVAILYDSIMSLHVATIKEHLQSFEKYSKNHITYIPSSYEYWVNTKNINIDLSIFDVVILHYSIRLSVKNHLAPQIYTALKSYCGLKMAFIQDEYEGTEITREWLEKIHFDIVYTCIPEESVERIYPKYRFPSTQFRQVLTGYISEDVNIDQFAKPLGDRKIDIAYRGRVLSPVYGTLGNEKYRIGIDVKKLAISSGLKVDIEVDAEKRIYGEDWYKFLGSARSTLGTESGSNIFDANGHIKVAIEKLQKENPLITFEDIFTRILSHHESEIKMNQISPKIFEAIRLKTALILFEGTYSNVVQPEQHYLSLKKDYSNIKEIFEKLMDDNYIEKMTSRAYDDIVLSGNFSYKSFIGKIDSDISNNLMNSVSRAHLFLTHYRIDDNGNIQEFLPLLPDGIFFGGNPFKHYSGKSSLIKLNTLGGTWGISRLIKNLLKVALNGKNTNSLLFIIGKKIWVYLPSKVQIQILSLMRT